MNLSPEEAQRIRDECLNILSRYGVRPDGNLLRIKSGSFGIRQLGKVDFLANTGFRIVWQGR